MEKRSCAKVTEERERERKWERRETTEGEREERDNKGSEREDDSVPITLSDEEFKLEAN